MGHDYYQFNKEKLLEKPKVPLICMPDDATVFRSLANEMTEEIRANNYVGKRTVLICPVGPTGQYPFFVDRVNRMDLNLKNTWFINMDEYLDEDKSWISADHLLSFRGYMERAVYTKIKPELVMPKEQRVFPDPDDIAHIPKLIKELGGVDIAFGGIGINGHVAFNEADQNLTVDEFLSQKTRVCAISQETRTANAIGDYNGALEDMPHYCVTIGINEIFHARRIRLGAFRSWHRAVVRRMAYGEETTGFPASLLQSHPDVTLALTDYVAALGD